MAVKDVPGRGGFQKVTTCEYIPSSGRLDCEKLNAKSDPSHRRNRGPWRGDRRGSSRRWPSSTPGSSQSDECESERRSVATGLRISNDYNAGDRGVELILRPLTLLADGK